MLKIRQLLLTSLLLVPVLASAQYTFNPAQDTIEWSAGTYSDSLMNSSGDTGDKFITYGSSNVNWFPEGTTEGISYAVQTTSGTWSNGSVTYNLVRNGRERKIRITQEGEVVRLTVSFNDPTNHTRTIHYIISSAQKIH